MQAATSKHKSSSTFKHDSGTNSFQCRDLKAVTKCHANVEMGWFALLIKVVSRQAIISVLDELLLSPQAVSLRSQASQL